MNSILICELNQKSKYLFTHPVELQSFGIESGVVGTTNVGYYSGIGRSGPTAQYTDLVLEGDFTATFKTHDARGNQDIFIGFWPETYATAGDDLSGDHGFATGSRWGAYAVPDSK